jgi:hypothetical protein
MEVGPGPQPVGIVTIPDRIAYDQGCRGMSALSLRAEGRFPPLVGCAGASCCHGCCHGPETDRSFHLAAQRELLINSTEIMLVVVVPVILMTLGFAWLQVLECRRHTG